ncbi:zinc-binding metallopeptidase family protein [Halochromatium glycolicum]|uniref:Zinc-ribbon domain-containing protein n=1 Tax=Halochromatium glycolicum TaxID=85075 RepID=A0AAJ0U5M3_9GAMM|nr:putative zinc-binding peptidase [Halochromatium glycolicum]MBK1705207.1 hypothetical protein [Halochromatium glycolicum]
MKLFSCDACGHTLYFDNVECTSCGHRLGFDPTRLDLIAFDLAANGDWQPIKARSTNPGFRPCANYAEHAACNWVVPATQTDGFCPACRLNRTIPDLSVPGNLLLWQRLQTEKHRLVYSLLRLGLAPVSKQQSPEHGLAFDFLGDPNPRFHEDSSVMTGHAQGLITIDIAEADDAVREKVRQEMAEPYRTILGHFRHESGHYYWDRLVRDSSTLADFRDCFGDERIDYDAALQKHYAEGPPTDWMQDYVSSYAAAHPWEDWAETWAHYLHMVDTLETAWQFGLRLAPRVDQAEDLATKSSFDPYTAKNFHSLTAAWFPLTIALNSLNRSMGQADAYPFVVTPVIQDKLQLVHTIIHS